MGKIKGPLCNKHRFFFSSYLNWVTDHNDLIPFTSLDREQIFHIGSSSAMGEHERRAPDKLALSTDRKVTAGSLSPAELRIQMKATEHYFPVVLSIMLYTLVLTFESVDEILKCDHSNESIGQYFPVVPVY